LPDSVLLSSLFGAIGQRRAAPTRGPAWLNRDRDLASGIPPIAESIDYHGSLATRLIPQQRNLERLGTFAVPIINRRGVFALFLRIIKR
jgi:hypothetical protein